MALSTSRGCATCKLGRKRCDRVYPACGICRAQGLDCSWSRESSEAPVERRSVTRNSSYSTTALSTSVSRTHTPVPLPSPSTMEADRLTHLLSAFHLTGYRLCSWSALLPLPRRSAAPSLLRTTKRKNTPRVTTWASYYLPHLATGSTNDALSLALAAYTGLVLHKQIDAINFYVKALRALRDILVKSPAAMSNQTFLQCWAATVLLADYEAQCGQVQTSARHIEGAAIFTELSLERFPIEAASNRPTSQEDSLDNKLAILPRNERCLPAYLREYSLRLRTSNFLCSANHDRWPQRLAASEDTADNDLMDKLYETSASCYWHVMTICEDYHTIIEFAPPQSAVEHAQLQQSFADPLRVTLEALQSYEDQLQHILVKSWGIFQQPAQAGHPFPGAPVFANPMLAVPWFLPQVLKIFLAPFLRQAEYHYACQSAKGVYKALEEIGQSALYEHNFPDCFVAALWERGVERDCMQAGFARREPLFRDVVRTIWSVRDAAQDAGRPLSKEQSLLLSMRTYRDELSKVLATPKGKYLSVGAFFGQPWSRLQRQGQFQKSRRTTVSAWRNRLESYRKDLQESNLFEGAVLEEGTPEPRITVEVEQAWFLI
ncbi:hypothetical protein BCR37DRAFT_40937 [Protomyces lactucae-debilis]|uniref:Zn(2)-C6 fungal-type domain-containing protein n=1 Tax=Protomyces lactucae-debilis TaxID=2754530 RepID=A0A1Y2FES5_PROLT|nr:uncharacterized protein BCR37DRAFT_40937 [Protomyces lactucae-debilis]ORY81335.1 hypothetical protein BCR37DRAFT_40937 [Protomyces lactucae-debilis]